MVELGSICVFCGSSSSSDVAHQSAARAMGALLAERGIDLIFGGSGTGLMGELADSCLAAGGRVIGVMPLGLFTREKAHTGLTELREVGSMHERKQQMYDLADAFVALPGGLGTLEELAEVTTWSQLGLHRKPVVLLDVEDFWAPLVALLDQMVMVGFLKPANRGLVQLANSPDEALDVLASRKTTFAEGWVTAEER